VQQSYLLGKRLGWGEGNSSQSLKVALCTGAYLIPSMKLWNQQVSVQ
jgi:hypothetical protein